MVERGAGSRSSQRQEPPATLHGARAAACGRSLASPNHGSHAHTPLQSQCLMMPPTRPPVGRLEVLVDAEGGALCIRAHPRLGVLGDPLLKEVGLALEGDEVHPVKGVHRGVEARDAQGGQQAVRAVLDVRAHGVRVHANEGDGQGVGDELLLDAHRRADDLVHALHGEGVVQHGVEQAREVAVQPLVPADELIGGGQAGHEAALLQPKDGAERPAEEDALHRREGDQALSEGGVLCRGRGRGRQHDTLVRVAGRTRQRGGGGGAGRLWCAAHPSWST